MIRDLYRASGPRGRTALGVLVPLMVVEALLQGALFIMLVPLLGAWAGGDTAQGWRWVGWMAAVAGVSALVMIVSGLLARFASSLIVNDLLTMLGERIQAMPLGAFTTDRSGEFSDIATRGIAFAASVPQNILRPVIAGVITPATIMIAICWMDWRVGVAMIITLPLVISRYRRIGREAGRTISEHSDAVGTAASRIIEFSRAQPALRAAGNESTGDRLVDQAIVEQHNRFAKATRSAASTIGGLGSTIQTMLALSVVTVAGLALYAGLDVAMLAAILVLVVRFGEPVLNAGALSGGFAQGADTLRRLNLLAQANTMPEPKHPASPGDNSIEFVQVSFGYQDAPVVADVSFTAPSGQMTAIIGPSGCGKTTLLRLACRFYDPQDGCVRLGGVSLPELGSARVRAAVAPVFQDVRLFNGTILENIWLGRPSATREEVVRAATDAGVEEIVHRMPSGWDTQVGEAGTALSGGERQRVAIARALVKNAAVLVLDEPTSSLDILTEKAIHRVLDRLRGDHTILVIAHRLDTIANADQIVMLNQDGRVSEIGTHEQLLAAEGDYARYWTERLEAAEWTINQDGG